MKGAAVLVGSQPLHAWRDYLRFHVIYAMPTCCRVPSRSSPARFMTRNVRPAAAGSRAQRAMEATQQAMSDALGQHVCRAVFPGRAQSTGPYHREQRDRGLSSTGRGGHLDVAGQQGAGSCQVADAHFGVGYPESWPDYSGLTVSPADAAGNLLRLSEWNYRNALARLGQPVDRREWRIAPHTVGAVLMFQQNAYNFAAALLQAPKFDATASDAANYGAIGAIVGHEVSHFVDTLGADYDAEGRKAHWWTADEAAHFDAVAEPLVEQFSSYRPFPTWRSTAG